MYLANYSFSIDEEIKALQNKLKMKTFIITTPELMETLNRILNKTDKTIEVMKEQERLNFIRGMMKKVESGKNTNHFQISKPSNRYYWGAETTSKQ